MCNHVVRFIPCSKPLTSLKSGGLNPFTLELGKKNAGEVSFEKSLHKISFTDSQIRTT